MDNLNVIFNSGEEKEVKSEFKGQEVIIKVREISWSEKNKILSKCFTYSQDGTISFAFDTYNKEMLKKVLVSISVGGNVVPPTEINDIFFSRISPAFGSILEKLVPKAFEEVQISDFFVKE